MRNLHYIGLTLLTSILFSCNNNGENAQTMALLSENNALTFTEVMLNASIDKDIVDILHSEAVNSSSNGLDESIYLTEILSENNSQTKSSDSRDFLKSFFTENCAQHMTKSMNNELCDINNIEIYWPYCEHWDGYSQPVIVINTYDDSQFIEDDKVYAYRITESNGSYIVDSLIVDEAYAMKNPVWVINNCSLSIDDILSIKNNYTATTINPTSKSSYVCETEVVTFKATEQHDVWINGGSEFEIHWLFPKPDNTIATNKSGLITFTREQINNKTTKTVNFIGNLDWNASQYCNRMVVVEVDESALKEIELSVPIKISETITITPTAKITLNKLDDSIMDYNIYRYAMFTVETKIDDTHYQKSFSGGGATAVVSIRSIETLPGI